jgi:O-antigen ligase
MPQSEPSLVRDSRSKHESLLFGGLVLFALSLALSKSANNILLGLVYLAVIYLLLRDRQFRLSVTMNIHQPLLVPLALYIGVALMGLLFTANITDGLGIIGKMTGLVLIYVVMSVLVNMVEDRDERMRRGESLVLAFLAGVFILDIIGVLTYFGIVAHRKYFLPLSALNVYHIWFANLNAVAVYAALAVLLFSRDKKDLRTRMFLFSFLPLGLASVLLSLSRTAWLGMVVTALILAFFVIKSRKWLVLALLALSAAGLGLYVFNPLIQSRINQIAADIYLFGSGQARTNVGERFLMWQSAFRMFLDNPLFGVGTGDYVATMNGYIASGQLPSFMAMFNQPHNIYLFSLATNGLPGLVVLLVIFYVCLKRGLSGMREAGGERFFAFLALATTVHYVFAGLTESMFNIQILRYTFAFIIGVCVRSSRKTGDRAA